MIQADVHLVFDRGSYRLKPWVTSHPRRKLPLRRVNPERCQITCFYVSPLITMSVRIGVVMHLSMSQGYLQSLYDLKEGNPNDKK